LDTKLVKKEFVGVKYILANKIYKFSNSNEKEFYFPHSNIFTSAIYDNNNNIIFSLLTNQIGDIPDKNIFVIGSNKYLKVKFKENIFKADTLIVAKKITHAKMIQNVFAILIVITFLVLLASFFIIKQSLEPYKRLNQYLENFFKDSMHELKTPIGVILLNLDGLDSMYEDNKMIKRAKSALKNMIVIYEDLEFFVRKNRVEHPKENINISNFIKERVEFFMDLLSSKEMQVIQNIEDNLYVNFSKLELSRIIDNTISNAIKYSKNQTKIEITLKKENENTLLIIKDEGKGIKDTDKIFDRHYRGDKISGGFGIGLSIVKNICYKNGVDIKIESQLKKGSTFIFSFHDYKKGK